MWKVAALVALLAPALASAEPGDANPPAVVLINPPRAPLPPHGSLTTVPEYETVYDNYNAPVFTAGAILFIGSYGASVVVSADASKAEKDRGADKLYIPVVGPWLALNDRGACPITDTACNNETTKKVLLVVDGVFQASGVLGMIDGILEPSSHRIVTQTGKIDTKVHVRPLTGAATGVSLSGVF